MEKMEMLKCSGCGQVKSEDEFHKNKAYKRGYSYYCKKCKKKLARKDYEKHKNHIMERNLDYYRKNKKYLIQKKTERRRKKINSLKHEIFMLFGNKCQRCGFDDVRALQIDHIHGGGRKETLQRKDIVRYYRKVLESVKSYKYEYQLLCANCNWIKRVEKGEV